MLNKDELNITALEDPKIRLELRPDPYHSLDLKIRTPTYPAGRIGGVQDADDKFRAVAKGVAWTGHGRLDSRVTLTPEAQTVVVTFTGHSLEGDHGLVTVDRREFAELVEMAIASRTGPRIVRI